MAQSGIITFHACHSSGTMISTLGEGTYDHLGFFGVGGVNDAVIVNNFNDSTWVVDASGNRNTSTWGALMNNKWIDASGCSTSGHPRKSVSDYQDADHTSSGTLLMWFRASGELKIDTYNAKLFAFDNLVGYNNPPEYVNVRGFEINPSGQVLDNYDVDEWSFMGGMANGIVFHDHSSLTNYQTSQNEHKWWCAVSARADAVGWLDDYNYVFTFQFA